jgi:DNA polymerase V
LAQDPRDDFKCTGIPVGMGIARTKTLAKLANHTAKRLLDITGGVVDICDPFKRDWTLRNTDVGEVWGVGKRMKAHLQAWGSRPRWTWHRQMPWMLQAEIQRGDREDRARARRHLVSGTE